MLQPPELDPDAVPQWLAEFFGHDKRDSRVITGINEDDCAIVSVSDELLLFTSDFLNASPICVELGIGNFETMGRLLVAQSLSDLCGSGAMPRYLLTNITMERKSTMKEFSLLVQGIRSEARKWNVDVIGGDTKLGKSTALCATAIGTAKSASGLFPMNGATSGSLIWASGFLGSTSAAVLGLVEETLNKEDEHWAKGVLTEPNLPLDKSAMVSKLGIGGGGTDISDGLGKDLQSMCLASGVGAIVDIEQIPVAPQALRLAAKRGVPAWTLAFASGGEFQFIVTSERSNREQLSSLGFHQIGEITAEPRILSRLSGGQIGNLPLTGHRDLSGLTFYEEINTLVREAISV